MARQSPALRTVIARTIILAPGERIGCTNSTAPAEILNEQAQPTGEAVKRYGHAAREGRETSTRVAPGQIRRFPAPSPHSKLHRNGAIGVTPKLKALAGDTRGGDDTD